MSIVPLSNDWSAEAALQCALDELEDGDSVFIVIVPKADPGVIKKYTSGFSLRGAYSALSLCAHGIAHKITDP